MQKSSMSTTLVLAIVVDFDMYLHLFSVHVVQILKRVGPEQLFVDPDLLNFWSLSHLLHWQVPADSST